MMNEIELRKLLSESTGKVDMILDTDTYNEIDDQFALTYAILSPERINLKAVTAAPFLNHRSESAEDGMLKSYDEILRVLQRLNISKNDFVYKGSKSFIQEKSTPIESEAARAIVRISKESDTPLYVTAIGAITNVASAILMDPEIVSRIVVVWLGGHPYYWETACEFNLMQDVKAAQIVFDSGVPLVNVPCKNVAEHLRSSVWEMEKYVKGRGKIGDFLFERYCDYSEDHFAWTKEVWDIAPVAWLNNPEWVSSKLTSSPVLTDAMQWERDPKRHLCRVAMDLNRDEIFKDFFTKLDGYAKKRQILNS